MPDDMSVREVMREVARLAASVDSLTQELRQDRTAAASTYVRQDVYLTKHEALDAKLTAKVNELERDVQEVQADRVKVEDRWKQALFAFGVQLVMMLIVGAVAVSNFMSVKQGG